MRVLIVDDNERFVRRLAGHFGAEAVTFSKELFETSSHAIAKSVSDSAADCKDTVVLINVHLRHADKGHQSFFGLEVLEHIRLTETFLEAADSYVAQNSAKECHCVLYSYLTAEQILYAKVGGAILYTEGTTFVRLPFDPARLNLRALALKKARVESLKPYVCRGFVMPDERHDWANWWGIKQLIDVHRVAADSTAAYPRRVVEGLEDLNAKQALMLYGLAREELSSVDAELLTEIKLARGRVGRRCPRILHIDDRCEDGWSETFVKVIYSEPRPSLNGAKGPRLADYRLNDKCVFRYIKDIGSLAEGNGDDPATKLYQAAAGAMKGWESPPQLILLDLRLLERVDLNTRREKGTKFSVHELSGAKLLEWLRRTFRGIPIIITTASNKAWSLEELENLGADAYWIKEGMDERLSASETAANYLRFLNLIESATGEGYKFLYLFDLARLALFQPKGELWWESPPWMTAGGAAGSAGRRAVVAKLLTNTVLLLRLYLQHTVMKRGLQSELEDWCWASAIVRHAANIIEEVHRFDSLPSDRRNSATIGDKKNHAGAWERHGRGDWTGFYLYAIRNSASHFNRAGKVNQETLRKFLSHLAAYLEFGPQPGFSADQPINWARLSRAYRDRFNKLMSAGRPMVVTRRARPTAIPPTA